MVKQNKSTLIHSSSGETAYLSSCATRASSPINDAIPILINVDTPVKTIENAQALMHDISTAALIHGDNHFPLESSKNTPQEIWHLAPEAPPSPDLSKTIIPPSVNPPMNLGLNESQPPVVLDLPQVIMHHSHTHTTQPENTREAGYFEASDKQPIDYLYEGIEYIASKPIITNFVANNISFYLFYGLTPYEAESPYLNSAIRSITFGTINMMAHPIAVKIFSEPLYEITAQAFYDPYEMLNDISYDSITENVQEAYDSIKYRSPAEIITGGVYSGTSKIIQDHLCENISAKWVCKSIKTYPASRVIKNGLKSLFGKNIFDDDGLTVEDVVIDESLEPAPSDSVGSEVKYYLDLILPDNLSDINFFF